MIVDVAEIDLTDPARALEDALLPQEREWRDLAQRMALVELVDREQFARPVADRFDDDVVEIGADHRQVFLGREVEYLQRLDRGRIVVDVERDEPDRGIGRQRRYEFRDRLRQRADMERAARWQLPPQRLLVHLEIALLPELRQVAIIYRFRHPGPGVEAGDLDAHAGLLLDQVGDLADVQEAGAARHTELERREGAVAAQARQVRCIEQREGELLPDQQVEVDLGARAPEQGDEQRDQVEMQRLAEPLDKQPAPAARHAQTRQ